MAQTKIAIAPGTKRQYSEDTDSSTTVTSLKQGTPPRKVKSKGFKPNPKLTTPSRKHHPPYHSSYLSLTPHFTAAKKRGIWHASEDALIIKMKKQTPPAGPKEIAAAVNKLPDSPGYHTVNAVKLRWHKVLQNQMDQNLKLNKAEKEALVEAYEKVTGKEMWAFVCGEYARLVGRKEGVKTKELKKKAAEKFYRKIQEEKEKTEGEDEEKGEEEKEEVGGDEKQEDEAIKGAKKEENEDADEN